MSDAREQLQESPKSAQAQRNLATALQADGKSEEAITYLTLYIAQRPKDQEALRELAGLHLTRAIAQAQAAQAAQERASFLTFGSTFGSAAEGRRRADARHRSDRRGDLDQADQDVTTAYTAAQESFRSAEQTYDKLVLIAPKIPTSSWSWLRPPSRAGTIPKAIAAYEQFLKLAPDDPSATLVKQQIAQLKQAQAQPASG